MKDILLFESDNGRARHLIFLLKMAEISCTLAKSLDETLNYISAQRLKIIDFDLLLLGSSTCLVSESPLYAEVVAMNTVPVVCIASDNDDCTRKSCPSNVVVCKAEDMLDCVKHQLDVEDSWQQTGLAQ